MFKIDKKQYRDIHDYTGLTDGQFNDLRDAVAGTLKTMNGARRDVMKTMIGPDLKATDVGLKTYYRALAVAEGEFIFYPDVFVTINSYIKAANLTNRQLQTYTNGLVIRSSHMKVLVSLARQPGISFRFLASIYGHSTITDLLKHKLIEQCGFDDQLEWSWFVLQNQAIYILEDLDGIV